MIADTIDSLLFEESEKKDICELTKHKVKELCAKYPIYNRAY